MDDDDAWCYLRLMLGRNHSSIPTEALELHHQISVPRPSADQRRRSKALSRCNRTCRSSSRIRRHQWYQLVVVVDGWGRRMGLFSRIFKTANALLTGTSLTSTVKSNVYQGIVSVSAYSSLHVFLSRCMSVCVRLFVIGVPRYSYRHLIRGLSRFFHVPCL